MRVVALASLFIRLFSVPARIAAVMSAFGLAFSVSASATLLYSLDFNTAGVLPSAQGFTYSDSSPGFVESDVFSTVGGVLQQRTTGVGIGNFSYTWTGGPLDPTLRTIIEARLEVLSLETASPEESGGIYFQALDGVYRYSLFFDATGVRIPNNTPGDNYVTLDYSGMHVYRLVSDGNSGVAAFYFDNVFVTNVNARANAANLSNFGDGITSSGNNGNANWDYIYLAQEDNSVVPVPGTWFLMGVGLILVAWGRRPTSTRSGLTP